MLGESGRDCEFIGCRQEATDRPDTPIAGIKLGSSPSRSGGYSLRVQDIVECVLCFTE
jgi:hypothetical protein